MLLYEPGNRVELRPVESPCPLEGNRLQPEFRDHVLASHIDRRRFAALRFSPQPLVTFKSAWGKGPWERVPGKR